MDERAKAREGLAGNLAAVWEVDDPLLWVVTAEHAGRRGGLLAAFVMQASIVAECPRVLIGIGKQHHTWGLIRESGLFVAHLIDPEKIDWCWRFGLETGWDRDKLAGLATQPASLAVSTLEDAAGWLECRVEAEYDTGDRSLFLGEIISAFRHPKRGALRTRAMFAAADAAQREKLTSLYARDGAIDREAIRGWRLGRAGARTR